MRADQRLLAEFSILVQKETDLRHLYFVGLPFILMAFGFRKGVVFKYSLRKRCFDPKCGLRLDEIREYGFKIEPPQQIGELADRLLAFDIEPFYRTAYNRKIRALNIPCSDIIRSVLNPLATKKTRFIDRKDVKNRHIRAALQAMELERFLYIPLLAADSTVGFMLFDAEDTPGAHLKPYASLFGLALANLVKQKQIDTLRGFIEENEEEILHNQRLYSIGKTASTIAHEIKNSLIAIIGLFNKLKEHTDRSERASKYVSIIESELDKLYRFALNINRYSRSLKPVKEFLDLRELVDKVIEMANILNAGFEFSVRIDDEASVIYADRAQMEQVLLNLLKNSIEAYGGERGGKVWITAKRQGDEVVIRIRDNSGGVDPEKLQEITRPFYTTKPHGTGLGLSIVAEIIRQHGGTIDFKNVHNGLESIIRMPLPKNLREGDDE